MRFACTCTTRLTAVATFAMLVTGSVCASTPVAVETITVTHPGNPGDAPHGGYGGVDYVYDIGQFEITAEQYTAFLNAVAADDTYGLYNPEMWSDPAGCKIERTGSPGSYAYSVASDWRDLPVNFVSWGDAVRFCNWMHNGQVTGPQGPLTTEAGSYLLNGATSSSALLGVTRTPNATWVLPTEDEWYKPAYHHNDGATANYWDYPTGSDLAPTSELPSGTDPLNGSANHFGSDYAIGGPYFRSDVGAYNAKPSTSPYGTFDQGGNVFEWNEGILFGVSRGMRGGAYYSSSDDLRSWNRSGFDPTSELEGFGFRLARLRNDLPPCTASPELLSLVDSQGEVTNMAYGDYFRLYLADGSGGLRIINVFDPTAPFEIGSYTQLGDAFDVVYDDFTVYVTDQNAGLRILYVGSPSVPSLLGSFDTGGPTFGVALQDDKAYLASFLGLHILDVSDPTNPTSLGSISLGGVTIDMAVEGDIVYAVSLDAGLQILDVSDPANILLLGIYDTPGSAVSVVVKNGIAYVADGDAGMQVIDVSNPTTPVLLDAVITPGPAADVNVAGDTVYVAVGGYGVQSFDASDAASIRTAYGTPGLAGGVMLNGSTLYVADGEYGMQIVDVGRLSISRLATLDGEGDTLDVAVVDTTAYVANFRDGLRIFDTSNPSAPQLLGVYDSNEATSVEVIGDIAYVVDEQLGLQIIDVSNPNAPVLLSSPVSPGGFESIDVALQGSTAFFVTERDLFVLDVSDPLNVVQQSSLSFDLSNGSVRGIEVQGDTVYLAYNEAGLHCIDVGDLANPVVIGTFTTEGEGVIDVALNGNIAYVLDRTVGLYIVDVTDPGMPTQLGVFEVDTNLLRVTNDGSTVYLSTAITMDIIDASEPTAPFQLDSYGDVDFAGPAWSVGERVYLPDGANGVQVLEILDACNPAPEMCPGDVTGDLVVDLTDLAVVLSDFGRSGADLNGDANGDQVVDLSDLALVLGYFGSSCL